MCSGSSPRPGESWPPNLSITSGLGTEGFSALLPSGDGLRRIPPQAGSVRRSGITQGRGVFCCRISLGNLCCCSSRRTRS